MHTPDSPESPGTLPEELAEEGLGVLDAIGAYCASCPLTGRNKSACQHTNCNLWDYRGGRLYLQNAREGV